MQEEITKGGNRKKEAIWLGGAQEKRKKRRDWEKNALKNSKQKGRGEQGLTRKDCRAGEK